MASTQYGNVCFEILYSCPLYVVLMCGFFVWFFRSCCWSAQMTFTPFSSAPRIQILLLAAAGMARCRLSLCSVSLPSYFSALKLFS